MSKKASKYSMTGIATSMLLIAISTYADKPKEYKGPKSMENLVITLISGQSTTIKEYLRRKPLYLKFWASWCQPCREQMPHLQNTYEMFGETVEVVGVNIGINDDFNAVVSTKREYKLSVPLAVDQSGDLSQAFNVKGTPYHLLIDIDGKVVYKGTEISDEFDEAINAISTRGSNYMPALNNEDSVNGINDFELLTGKYTALFFTSTWCDWYLSESRPKMSANCVNAQNQINELSKNYTGVNWIGLVSRLWTGKSDLEDYVDKYKINYSTFIDETNKYFFKYKVNKYPTLVLLKDGEEISRTSEFSDPDGVNSLLKEYGIEL